MQSSIFSNMVSAAKKLSEGTNFLTELVIATAIGGLLTLIGQIIDRVSKRPSENVISNATRKSAEAKAASDIAQAYSSLVDDLTVRISFLETEVQKIPAMQEQISKLTVERELLKEENARWKEKVEELSKTVEQLQSKDLEE